MATATAEAKPPFKIPKTLGAVVDRVHQLREEIKLANAKITPLEAEVKALEEHLIQNLPKSDARGIAGKNAKAMIITKPVPTAEDWDAIYAYVTKKKAFELLQRRLSETAIKERWENGETIPGVGTYNVIKVSVTKL